MAHIRYANGAANPRIGTCEDIGQNFASAEWVQGDALTACEISVT